MIAVSIIAILATIGVPMYASSLNSARYAKAKQELKVISQAIELHKTQNQMLLPVSLEDVGHGGRRDPWGSLYCYLNLQTGSGDGMDWAFDAGLVDPSLRPARKPSVAVAVANAQLSPLVTHQSIADFTQADRDLIADTVGLAQRSDRFLFPLNTDFDLFSRGPDRTTAASLRESIAFDDMIRANDGDFFGKASDY
jgi:general secretion pathway protein G